MSSCRPSIPRWSTPATTTTPQLLKEFHLDPKKERQIRKSFGKLDQQPKILIVTEKLLTGFDAPVLYAMYLDKPMRDHTLLQAIARVNRPYENEAQEMVKPHGFVLDFVGIFDKLEKALAFDSDEINAIVKDLKLLKVLFKNKMEQQGAGVPRPDRAQLQRQGRGHPDRALPRSRSGARSSSRNTRRSRCSTRSSRPDAFLRPFIDDYGTLSAIYDVVRKAYTKRVYGRSRVPAQDQRARAGTGRQLRRRAAWTNSSRSTPTPSS